MSEEWKVQASYKSSAGALLNIRADELAELAGLVDEAKKRAEFAEFFGATTAPPILKSIASGPTPGGDAYDAAVVSDEQAIAVFEKHLGPAATPAQVALLVKRFGKTEEEAQALTRAQAAEIIKEGNK